MIKLMPWNLYDVSAQQAWLEDQAARGWFYVPSRPILYLVSFERGTPRAVRYRLEPAGQKEKCPDQERRDTYRLLGWEYVDTFGKSMHLWRCDNPEAPELHTDPETEARAYDRISRRMRHSEIAAAVTALVMAALFIWLYSGPMLYSEVRDWTSPWRVISACGVLLLLIFYAVRQDLALRRFLKTLRAGVPVPHRSPYRRARWGSAALQLLWVVWMSALWFGILLEPHSHPFQPLESFDEPVPHVAVQRESDVKAIRWQNWLTSEQWCTVEDDGNPRYLVGEAQYYRLRFPSLADNLVKGVLAEYEELGWPITEMQYPGLDEAWAGETEGGYRYLVLRLGDQVWDAGMHTERPLEELLGQYAAAMAEARQG